MKHAILTLEQHLLRLTTHLGKAPNQLDLLAEIGRTVQSLQELHTIQDQVEAARKAMDEAQPLVERAGEMEEVLQGIRHTVRHQAKGGNVSPKALALLVGMVERVLPEDEAPIDPTPPAAASISSPVLPDEVTDEDVRRVETAIQRAPTEVDLRNGLEKHLTAQGRHRPNGSVRGVGRSLDHPGAHQAQ